jgi:hypothetical protein
MDLLKIGEKPVVGRLSAPMAVTVDVCVPYIVGRLCLLFFGVVENKFVLVERTRSVSIGGVGSRLRP